MTELRGGRVVSRDGTRINYLRLGTGPVVVGVHGALASGVDWLPVARVLAESYSFVLFDRRGHGASDIGNSAHSMAAEVEDLAAVVDAVGPARAVLSHSFGAVVAMHAAVAGVGVGALVVYEPPLMIDPVESTTSAARSRELLDRGEYEAALINAMRETLGMSGKLVGGLQRDPQAWAEMVAKAPVLVDQTETMGLAAIVYEPFRAITAPTLLLVGELSRTEPFGRSIATLADTIPRATVVRLAGHGHTAMLQDPIGVADVVARFLDES